MTIDEWDLFAVCESLLFISDKPVTVEQVVAVLEREHEEQQEREAEALDEQERLNRIANADVRDAAFDVDMRSASAAESMASGAEGSANLEGFEELAAATDSELHVDAADAHAALDATDAEVDTRLSSGADVALADGVETELTADADTRLSVGAELADGVEPELTADADATLASDAALPPDAEAELPKTKPGKKLRIRKNDPSANMVSKARDDDAGSEAAETVAPSEESTTEALATADEAGVATNAQLAPSDEGTAQDLATADEAAQSEASATPENAAASPKKKRSRKKTVEADASAAADGNQEAPELADGSTTEAVAADENNPTEQTAADAGAADEPQLDKKEHSPEAVRRRKLRRELTKMVEDAFAALTHAYADPNRLTGRGLQVVNVGGAFQMRTNPACAPFIRHHLQVKPTRLSRAQVETLAIIAYKQPVTRPEIEQVRGVDAGAAVKILLDRRLIRILGKKEDVGRPLLYGTTKEFLEFFNLQSLLELPTLREFQELSDEHKRKVEEELEADAPLGNLRELADGQPTFQVDDSELLADVDVALQGAKDTVARVSELTGMKATDEDGAPVVKQDA